MSATQRRAAASTLTPVGRLTSNRTTPLPFDWPLANEAEALLREHISRFLKRNQFARKLANRMRNETGTDFFEWVDHLVLPPGVEKELCDAGFVPDQNAETPKGEPVYEHPRATLPRVLLGGGPFVVALRPEFVADFMASHNLSGEPEGEPCSRYRRIVVDEERGTRLEAVERRAYRGFVSAPLKPGELRNVIKARELFRTRPRSFGREAEGFRAANRILDRVLRLVGRDMACQFFFEAERAYWESRNRAARIQKHRQDRLGLGWGNHDHHTFRSSRAHFVDLVKFLLRLGFTKRERYYAGAEAGWGAQISEQAVAGIVVFADVDLLPEETQVDFSIQQVAARNAPRHRRPLGGFARGELPRGGHAPSRSPVRLRCASGPVEGLRRQHHEPVLRFPVPAAGVYRGGALASSAGAG